MKSTAVSNTKASKRTRPQQSSPNQRALGRDFDGPTYFHAPMSRPSHHHADSDEWRMGGKGDEDEVANPSWPMYH
jgi:hypothetical protein